MSFRSFQKELMVYTLGLVLVTIVLTTAIGIFSTKTAGNDAADATSDVLSLQGKEFLIQVATAAAQQQDFSFVQIRNNTQNLAFYTSKIYENPSIFSIEGYWDFDTRVIRKDGRYVNNASDISTFHIPSFVVLDEAERKNIELTAALDFIVPSILGSHKSIASIYTIDNKGVTRYFPNIVLGELGPPDYDPRGDIYYFPSNPDNNPERKVIWSPLYNDAAGRGLMITVTAPVYVNDVFMGIAATDVLLESIINTITAYTPIEGSYAFLVDRKGITIAFPDKAYEDILGRPRANNEEGRINLFDQNLSEDFSAALKGMTSGAAGFSVLLNRDEGDLFLAYAPLQQTGFSMGIVAEKSVVLRAVATLHEKISSSISGTIINLILPASLFIIFIALVIGIFISNRVVRPIQELTDGVREISKGNLEYSIKVKSSNEIGELASSFNQMSGALKRSRQKLYEYSQGLEEQVKQRTKELTAANSRLRELDRMKSDFISIASHQLRTPLTATKGYVSMILEGTYGKISDEVGHVLTMVYESNERLVRMVDGILNLSRMESGRFQYKFEKVSLVYLLDGVIKELAISAGSKGLKIKWVAPRDNAEQFKIFADGEKLRQVFLNILDNAIKYTQKGYIEIKLVEDSTPRHVRVSVKDTGVGISPEDQKGLFQRFIRGKEGSRTNATGSGIGLYIAKKIVKGHEGRIWAKSEGVGKGSTFIVVLPINPKQES